MKLKIEIVGKDENEILEALAMIKNEIEFLKTTELEIEDCLKFKISEE